MIERLLAMLPRGARAVAIGGILVGLAAAWVALPPVHVRSPKVIRYTLLSLSIGSSWPKSSRAWPKTSTN